VLVYRASARVVDEPLADTAAVESAQALQSRHGDADLELLEADGAFGIVHAVLLRCQVGEHARQTARGGGRRRGGMGGWVGRVVVVHHG
jgi:hypothetical protein